MRKPLQRSQVSHLLYDLTTAAVEPVERPERPALIRAQQWNVFERTEPILSLQFSFHGVRCILGLFARPLHVLAEAVDRVASCRRAHKNQHQYCDDYPAHE